MPPSDATPATGFDLTLNGRTVRVEGASPTTTLLDWLRASGRTGSKCGCAEGDCGACTVALVDRNAAGQATYRAVNSCIALLPMFADREIVTVEGLAEGPKLHPVQAAMVEHYGSQCGYCTPGFVVSMFEAYYRDQCQEPWQISDQLSGNLCRCTGYRPIRDAAVVALASRSVGAELAPPSGVKGGHAHEGGASSAPTIDPFAVRLKESVSVPSALDYAAASGKFLRPTSLTGLFELLARKSRCPAGGGRDGDRRGVEQEVQVLPAVDFDGGRAGTDTHHADRRRLAHRGPRPR